MSDDPRLGPPRLGEAPVLKLVHAADLHIDSPLQGLSQYEGAPVEAIRGATRRALENLVQLCLGEGDGADGEPVDALLLAGDLFDGEGLDQRTGLFFASQLARLGEAGVQVVLVRGNHDAQSRVFEQLRLTEHVHELSRSAPETRLFEELGLAVHGQGFERRVVTDDLAAGLPEPCPGLFNVGLLHTSLDGRPGHDVYAPSTVEVLASKGYGYWALGHVHAREVVSREPWIVYPGNLQGRHVRETGAKGASVVRVDDGRVLDVQHRALDVMRWARLSVDASDRDDVEAVVDALEVAVKAAVDDAEGRLLAVRCEVLGASAAHSRLVADPDDLERRVRDVSLGLGRDAVWVESVRVRTRQRIDLAAVRERDDPLGGLARHLAALAADEAALAELLPVLAELKLPAEARQGDDGLRLDDTALIAELVREAEQLLLPRFFEEPAS